MSNSYRNFPHQNSHQQRQSISERLHMRRLEPSLRHLLLSPPFQPLNLPCSLQEDQDIRSMTRQKKRASNVYKEK